MRIDDLLSASEYLADLAFLECVASRLKCDWAVSWQVDVSTQTLGSAAIWLSAQIDRGPLFEDTRRRRLAMSEGMPGHIWKRKEPFLSVDLIRDMSLPRSIAACSAGLTTGLWFPVLNEHRVFEIIELLSVAPLADETLLADVKCFGHALGRCRMSAAVS